MMTATAEQPAGRTEAVVFGDTAVETQRRWAARPLQERLYILRAARHAIAGKTSELSEAIAPNLARSKADTLVAEVLPLLEACRFLEREAPSILKPRKLGLSGRPLWLSGVWAEVHREPIGRVLVIGPANFPLFLPGTQVLQALAAGNAVTWKPGSGGARVAKLMASILDEAGLPRGVLLVTEESADAGREALKRGADKIVFTGSPQAGREVLRELAETQTPAVMELSGNDAIVLLPSADLRRVAAAVAFGLRLNGSAVCMSPRRLFAERATMDALRPLLRAELEKVPAVTLREREACRLAELVQEAKASGAEVEGDVQPFAQRPLIVARVSASMRIAREEIFAPVLALIEAPSNLHLPELIAQSPFALTVSVFGEEKLARAMATLLRAGTVLINDVIVPTADPRVPFGGRGASGFGVTRGAEGLLEMTAVKTILVRRGRSTRHMQPTAEHDFEMFEKAIRASHAASLKERLMEMYSLVKSAAKRK